MTERSVSMSSSLPRGFLAAGLLLGIGLGGFVDGIVLHQILQWHHMLTAEGSYPANTVGGLEDNTLWDGLFHALTWIATAAGLGLLWRTTRERGPGWGYAFAGLLLLGWGLFNLVEGTIDHHILTIHHVRDDVEDPIWWDLGFLAFGAALVGTGLGMIRFGMLLSGTESPAGSRPDVRPTPRPGRRGV